MIDQFLTDLVQFGEELEALIVDQTCENERFFLRSERSLTLLYEWLLLLQVLCWRLRCVRHPPQVNIATEKVRDDV